MVVVGRQVSLEGAAVHMWNLQLKHYIKMQYVLHPNASSLLSLIDSITVALCQYDHLRPYNISGKAGYSTTIPPAICPNEIAKSTDVHQCEDDHFSDIDLLHHKQLHYSVLLLSARKDMESACNRWPLP